MFFSCGVSVLPCHSSNVALDSACHSSCCVCSCGAPTVVPPPQHPAAWILCPHLSTRSDDAAAGRSAGEAGIATVWWRGPWLKGERKRSSTWVHPTERCFFFVVYKLTVLLFLHSVVFKYDTEQFSGCSARPGGRWNHLKGTKRFANLLISLSLDNCRK